MASQLPDQTIRDSALKPLNPNAEPFYAPIPKTLPHQLGLQWGHGFFQIQSPVFLRPIYTYHPPPCLGFFWLAANQMGFAACYHSDCKAKEHTGERMISNAQRPARFSDMSRKRNRPSTIARRERGNSCKVTNKVLRDEKTSDGHPIIPFPTTVEDCNKSSTTTVMIKNIPYHFERKDLLLILDEHCSHQNQSSGGAHHLSMYDFVYLPMDYKKFAQEKKQSNLGYAFVNFTSARAAFRFFLQFNGHEWPDNENWKVCEVTKAQIQGKAMLMKKFEDKLFRCVHPSFRPVEYRPAREGANHGIKEISVGKFEEGMPDTSKPRMTLLNRRGHTRSSSYVFKISRSLINHSIVA